MKTEQEIIELRDKWLVQLADYRHKLDTFAAVDVLYSKRERKKFRAMERNIADAQSRITMLVQILQQPFKF